MPRSNMRLHITQKEYLECEWHVCALTLKKKVILWISILNILFIYIII